MCNTLKVYSLTCTHTHTLICTHTHIAFYQCNICMIGCKRLFISYPDNEFCNEAAACIKLLFSVRCLSQALSCCSNHVCFEHSSASGHGFWCSSREETFVGANEFESLSLSLYRPVFSLSLDYVLLCNTS